MMTRNLKVLGLALFAAFAMSAVGASAASAQDLFTTSNGKPVFLHGEQVGTDDNVIFNTKWKDAPMTCTAATLASTGTVASGAKEFEVHPSYSGCILFGQPATYDTTGCDFILTGTTHSFTNTNGNPTGKKDATVSFKCSAGNSIKITVPSVGCTITATEAENQNLLGVVYTNEGSGSTADFKVDLTIDEIHYTSTFARQLGGYTATDDDGFRTQTVTFKGYQGALHGTQVGISVS